jgi:hypothetical protein
VVVVVCVGAEVRTGAGAASVWDERSVGPVACEGRTVDASL